MKKQEKIWQNRWICSPEFAKALPRQMLHKQLDPAFHLEEHREDLKNHHTLFRKKIWIQPGTRRVFLDISADDYYKLYINGAFVTQGPANSYPFCYYYNHVDITGAVRPGENMLCVHVYYQGLVNRAFNSGDYRQGMIAEVWADGKQIADNLWRCRRTEEYGYSCTLGYDTQFDEIIDNRKKSVGWKEPGYDDSKWPFAPVKEEDDHVLLLQETPNVAVERRLPVEVRRIKRGYFLDFGEELTGTLSMKAWGRAGDVVMLRFGEELLEAGEGVSDAGDRALGDDKALPGIGGALPESGRVRYELRCNCRYEDKWILAEGENELEPYDYKCFRYAEIFWDGEEEAGGEDGSEFRRHEDGRLWPEENVGLQLSDFQVLYRHYPFEERFPAPRFSDPLLSSIWRICRNAVRNCAQESFLDCPQREKGQYLGDLTVTAHALFHLTGDTKLFQKALTDFAHSTAICPGMMAVAPGSFMQEIADFSLLFPYQLLLYARLAGEKEPEVRAFLKEMLPVAEKIAAYFQPFKNSQGLLENVKTKWNLVDWPENLRDGYDFDLSQPVVGDGCHNVINALYIGMLQCIGELKGLLGLEETSQDKLILRKLKAAFLQTFYCEETGLFVDSAVSRHSSLHANVYPVFYGLAPEGNHIVELIRERGLCCGVFTAYFVLYGLIRQGGKGACPGINC